MEALDRLTLIEMRPPELADDVMGPLYRLLRAPGDPPLHRQLLGALRPLHGAGARALLITGLVDSLRYPAGEIDGPVGATALGRALTRLGWQVRIAIEPEAVGPAEIVRDAVGADIEVGSGEFPHAAAAQDFGAQFDVLSSIEKLGRNAQGVRHLVNGRPSQGGDPFSDDYMIGAMGGGQIDHRYRRQWQ